jgi:hypothetical protein
MTRAVNLTFPNGIPGANRIKDPMNKTLHMEIKKARKRREEREPKAPGPFNGIKGLEKLKEE